MQSFAQEQFFNVTDPYVFESWGRSLWLKETGLALLEQRYELDEGTEVIYAGV